MAEIHLYVPDAFVEILAGVGPEISLSRLFREKVEDFLTTASTCGHTRICCADCGLNLGQKPSTPP